MVRPDWRHLPKYKDDYSSQMKKDIELAWSSEPSDPITYQFYYKILDGDDYGRGPTDVSFNWKSKSCLFLIANSANKVCICYPCWYSDSFIQLIACLSAGVQLMFIFFIYVRGLSIIP